MRAECYSLDLYCDNDPGTNYLDERNPTKHNFQEFPHRFTGHTQGDCYRAARRRGWLLGKERDLCPKCSGKLRRMT